MARFRLVVGPVPAPPPGLPRPASALDAGEWQAGRPPAARARARRALRLQPDHRPPGALGAGPRGPDRADPRPRHVRPPAPGRARLRRQPVVHERDAEPRPRRRDEGRGGAPGGRRRGGRERAGPRDRRADAVPRAPPARRRRAAAPRAGPPAGRPLPGPARLGPRAQLALRPAHRALRDPRRPGPRGDRADPAPGPRGAPCSGSPAAGPRCSSRASRTPPTGCPSSSPGASSAATGRATTSSASWCAQRPLHRPPRWRSRARVPAWAGWPARAGKSCGSAPRRRERRHRSRDSETFRASPDGGPQRGVTCVRDRSAPLPSSRPSP